MPERTTELELTGRLLIWTARHWVRARRRHRDLPAYVVNTLTQLRAGEQLLLRLEALLALLLVGARRPLLFACPEDGALSADERSLLLALSASRAGLWPEVRLALADCQQGAGLRATEGAVRALAAVLTAAGLRLGVDGAGWRAAPEAAAAPSSGVRTA